MVKNPHRKGPVKILHNDIKFGELLGHGGQAVVFKASISASSLKKRKLAVKLFLSSHEDDKRAQKKEIENMTRISHPNLLRLRGLVVDNYTDNNCNGIILDEMAHSLYNVIYDPSFSAYEYYNQISLWFCQAASGLSYLHRKGIVHRDIKPQNMLLDSSCNLLKICDFGSSKRLDKDRLFPEVRTICYQAPEMISGEELDQYSELFADVYSFGITMYEVYYRRKPYDKLKELSNYELATEIVKGARPMEVGNTVITADPLCLYYCLLPRLWCSNPTQRLSMDSVTELFLHRRDYKYLQGILGSVT